MNSINNDLSIIVYSCFRNRDMWLIFSELFRKYWDDCKFKVYLLTDKYEDDEKYVFDEAICIDSDWAEMMKFALARVNTPYVMLFMDDYLLTEKVDNNDIDHILETAKIECAANIRLCYSSIVKTYPYKKNMDYDYLEPGTAYSMSTHVGVWSSAFLNKNIKPGWSAWDFERIGSMNIADYDHPVLQSKKYLFPYVEGVRQGKWMPEGINVCKQNNIELDYSIRSKMSIVENFIAKFKGVLLKVFPNSIIRIQNILSKK